MKSLTIVHLLVCTALSSHVWSEDAVQWRVEDGGNGHWYELVNHEISHGAWIGWEASHVHAQSRGGHLVTITSDVENAFIGQSFQATNVWIGAKRVTGPWFWVSGEGWNYTAWNCHDCHGSCQPDSMDEDYGTIMCLTDAEPRWGNYNRHTLPYHIIEWDQDCDGDGIVDHGQILDGSRSDADQDGVPDCCQAGIPVCDCSPDLDEDGQVRASDLGILLSLWGTDGSGRPSADLDGDGSVDAGDLGLLIAAWGSCP